MSPNNTTVETGVQETSIYDNVDITEKKKKIVEYIARYPNATNKEVSESVGCSISYPSPVRDEFGDLILERAKELGSDLSELSESIERREKKRADSWDTLTVRQRKILRRLSEEDDPENPTSSLRGIIEDLDFETHPTTIIDTKNKYIDYAKKLKKARNVASDNEDPESLIDSITLDESNGIEHEKESVTELTDETDDTGIEGVSVEDSASEETINSLLEEIQSQKKMARSEMEYSSSELAAGRLVMAERIEDKLKEVMNT